MSQMKVQINPSHRGMLHADLGVPQGQKIPMAKLESAKHSKSPAVRRRANFAMAAKGWKR
jgi:hypothetical protein